MTTGLKGAADGYGPNYDGADKKRLLSKAFTRFATLVAKVTGRPITFILCVTTIVVWGLSGPIFHFSDTWQLVINTGTTIITFLQVFLIQNTQNRDGAAIQAKLDELIRASAAQNRYMGIEELTEEELTELRAREGVERAGRLSEALEAGEQAEETVRKEAEAASKRAKPRFS
jgi:low affinity Fe/Cu permease